MTDLPCFIASQAIQLAKKVFPSPVLPVNNKFYC